jgi:uncharacterized membrane protein
MSTVAHKLKDIELELAMVQAAVTQLRQEAEAARDAPAEAAPAAAPAVAVEEPLMKETSMPWTPRLARSWSPAPALDEEDERRPLMDFVGPRLLAWAGGAAMLAGIIFVFVLAVHRGWVNAELRLMLGAAVSTCLVGVGFWLRRRDAGVAALAATAAGFGGMFVTIFATTSLYGFLPDRVGIALAELVGAVAVAVAVRWKSEIIAGLGLVGAIGGSLVLYSGDPLLTSTFIAVGFAAFARVAVTMNWYASLVAGVALALPLPLASVLSFAGQYDRWLVLAIAGGFAITLLEAAVRWEARREIPTLTGGALFAASVAMSGALAVSLFPREGLGLDQQGVALAVASLPYLAAGVWLWMKSSRDSATAAAATGLVFLGLGVIAVFDGVGRVFALAAVTMLLAWLSARLDVRRIAGAAVVYFGATVVAAMTVAPLTDLLDAERASGMNALALIPVMLAALALAHRKQPDKDRFAGAWTAGVSVFVGVSALVLWMGLATGGGEAAFQRGHTAMSLVWAGAGLGMLWLGIRRTGSGLRQVGVLLLCLSLGKIVLFDLANLDAMARALSFMLVGGALLAGGVLVGRATPAPDQPGAVAAGRQ